MKRMRTGIVGVDQGAATLFSDFEDGGSMWTGTGTREIRHPVRFGEMFAEAPAVMVGISMWDIDQQSNQRADISAASVTEKGFDIVFRTWADTRVARIRANWIAIGALPDDEVWDV